MDEKEKEKKLENMVCILSRSFLFLFMKLVVYYLFFVVGFFFGEC